MLASAGESRPVYAHTPPPGALSFLSPTRAAHDLNITTIVLDPSPSCPASAVASEHIVGSFTDTAAIAALAARCNVLTVEIEHVNVEAIAAAAVTCANVVVHPSPACVGLVQDKLRQKVAMREGGLPLGPFRAIESVEELLAAGGEWGYPLMLKSRKLAYDGRGNAVVRSAADAPAAWATLIPASGGGGLYAEAWVGFTRELAVVVVRGRDGTCVAYPTVHTIQRDNICHLVVAPAAGVAPAVAARASEVAASAVRLLDGAGVFGVECFECADGSVLLNEIAPRVHNSGHFTIEGSECSQFENHVRAVMGLPLGSTAMRTGAALMINLLGSGSDAAAAMRVREQCARALATPGATLHWYGKADVKAARKMGHVTLTGARMAELAPRAAYIAGCALPDLGPSAVVPSDGSPSGRPAPLVAIIMGSDSDLPCMSAAAQVLADFGVPAEVTVVSAHRTPDRMFAYAREARARGIRVIIAGAGGAAHLPGMVAALTPLPVIGVPVPLKHLDGVDSLHSILQMPKGIPVATVAIGNAANAGLLAVRMLGTSMPALLDGVEAYADGLAREVAAKAAKLEAVGWQAYLKTM